MNPELHSILQAYFITKDNERCYPGLIFYHGKRTILQINVCAIDLPNLLQAKPASANNPESGKDRPEIPGHAEEIKQYIIDRVLSNKSWLLGTFTANVAPEMITVNELDRGFCIVRVPQGIKLDLTDGQHRLKAITELMQDGQTKFIYDETLPITLILEDRFQQCQTDFKDLSEAKPVDRSLLLSFSPSSARSAITKNLIEEVSMFRGKTDKVNKQPRKNSKLIYTSNYIARAVSSALRDKSDDNLDDFNVVRSSKELSECFNYFFAESQQTHYISQTNVEKLTIAEIKEFKQNCLLGVSVGLEVLGRLLYCTYDETKENFNLSKVWQLTQLDWSRNNNLWHRNVVRLNTKNSQTILTIAWGAGAISDAVKAAKKKLGWI